MEISRFSCFVVLLLLTSLSSSSAALKLNVETELSQLKAQLHALTTALSTFEFLTEGPCPQGFTEVTSSYGRYVVIGGSAEFPPGTMTGVALSNSSENRPAGAHGHSINDPGHAHSQIVANSARIKTGGGWTGPGMGSAPTGVSSTGISVSDFGGVQGTPAPFRVKRLCSLSRPKPLPCVDKLPVQSSNLSWPFDCPPPWSFQKTTIIVSSASATETITSILNEDAPGLTGYTYKSALSEFQSRGCAIMLHGGSVRDVFSGKTPKDIDVEYTCDYEQFASICLEVFNSSCQLHPETTKFELGLPGTTDPLEGISWIKTIQQPSFAHDFTVNDVSFDINGLSVTYDFAGDGIEDICTKTLRIPGPKSAWNDWLYESAVYKQNGIKKLPRYFKFTAPPYQFSPTIDTQAFVVNATISLWNDPVWNAADKFRSELCRTVAGKTIDGACIVKEEPSEAQVQKQKNILGSMVKDLGSVFVDVNVVSVGMISYQVAPPMFYALPFQGEW